MTDLEKARQTIDQVDREMARLFEQRMDAVRLVAEYKMDRGLPVEDRVREAEVLLRNLQHLENADNQPYYAGVLQAVIEQSKRLQFDLHRSFMVHTSTCCYPIFIRQGGLHQVGDLFHLNRKVLIVSDSGVPEDYAMTVASQCDEAVLFVFERGEASKCMDTYKGILQALVDNHFTRTDCIVAVGGGVVGDVAGLAASTYMRGVDFYNIPTTVLAQVDASIGGKTAIDFAGYKNVVGAFYPPKGVLIDVDVLQTLPRRQIANGMAEVIKMAITCDTNLFELLESSQEITEEIISCALWIKKRIVEADEQEIGLRKVLNFGHTLGHGIESVVGEWYHGECVAMGMLPMCASSVRERLLATLKKWDLPTELSVDTDALIAACRHDKKTQGKGITIVCAPEMGKYELKTIPFAEFETMVREVLAV